MTIRLLIDMSLSVEWVAEFARLGWTSAHWSSLGNPRATDAEILKWALDHDHVVFTHDLDFGTLLALTHANGPSVVQVRGSAVLPEDIGPIVAATLRQHEQSLADGALVVVELRKSRVRVLPI